MWGCCYDDGALSSGSPTETPASSSPRVMDVRLFSFGKTSFAAEIAGSIDVKLLIFVNFFSSVLFVSPGGGSSLFLLAISMSLCRWLMPSPPVRRVELSAALDAASRLETYSSYFFTYSVPSYGRGVNVSR